MPTASADSHTTAVLLLPRTKPDFTWPVYLVTLWKSEMWRWTEASMLHQAPHTHDGKSTWRCEEGREAGLETADRRQLKHGVRFFLEKNQVEKKTPDTSKRKKEFGSFRICSGWQWAPKEFLNRCVLSLKNGKRKQILEILGATVLSANQTRVLCIIHLSLLAWLFLTSRLQPVTVQSAWLVCQGLKLPLERKQLLKSPKIQRDFSSQVAVLPSACSILASPYRRSRPSRWLLRCYGDLKIQPCNWSFLYCSEAGGESLKD